MPAIQRDLLHRFLVDGLADRHGGAFNHRRGGLDVDDFAGVAYLQAEVLHGIFADFQHQIIGLLRLEALALDLDRIGAGRKHGHFIFPVGIGFGGALNAERGVFHRDGGAIDGRAILVGDCAFNAGGVLRESSCGRKQHREQQREKSLPEHLCLLKVQTTVEQV